jgi:MFS family permease
MVVGGAGIVGFVLAERRYGDDALLPLRLFRGRTFGVGSLLNFILGMGMFGGLAVLPLYLQIVKGQTPTEAGLLLLPLTFGIMSGSVLAGQVISRTGRYKRFPVVGAALLVAGLGLLSTVGVGTPLWQTLSMATLFGVGLGFNMQPLTLAVQNAVPPRDMGVATSSTTFFRQMGGTLGTAVFLSVLFSTVGGRILTAFRDTAPTPGFRAALRDPQVLAEPTNAAVVEALRSGDALPAGSLDDTSFLARLDPRVARPFLEGFAGSMDLVFGVAAMVLLVGFVVVLFLPEEPLRSLSGLQAQRREAADTAAAAAEVTAPSSQMVDGTLLDGGPDDAEEPVLPRAR